MSWFNTTATLKHVTSLPSSTTFAAALERLQDHDLLIKLDPELAHYESLPSEPAAPDTKRYKVTDHMHTLPKGLWDTTVTFECQLTNRKDGVDWMIKAPLGLLQTTQWRIVKREEVEKGKETASGEEDGEWCLVEDVEIKASRLLVGTVKGKCEENWRGIHSTFVGHLKSAVAAA